MILFQPSEQTHLIITQDIKDKLSDICFIDSTQHNPLITDYDFLQEPEQGEARGNSGGSS